jgi:peptide/nickel transport system substrate-binding protein
VDAIESADDTEIETQAKSSVTELRINLETEPTSDGDLRKALNHAVSQEQLIEATQNGLAVPARGILPPMFWAAAYDSLPVYDGGPERGRELVEESIYDGETLVYVTTEGTPRSSTLVAEVIQQAFDDIGVDMEIQTVGSSTWSERIEAGDGHFFTNTEWLNFTAEFFSEVRRFGSPEGGIYYHEHPTNQPNDDIQAELDPAIEEARTTEDDEKYRELLIGLQEMIMEDALLLPLFHQEYLVGMRTGMEGVDWHPALTSTRMEDLTYYD